MSKPITSRAKRRKLERDIQRNSQRLPIDLPTLVKRVKYEMSDIQSEALFNSQSDRIFDALPDLPQSISNLRKDSSIYGYDNILKELKWYSKFIKRYSEEITCFLELEEKFESNFISGEYLRAKEILNEIENRVCASNWGVEKRLLIAEYGNGFKQNKEILAGLVDKENNAITNILARYQSIRIEKNLSFIKSSEIINGLFKSYIENPGIEKFFQFKLDFYSHSYHTHHGYILDIESGASIIDKYITFIHVICLLLCQTENYDKSSEVASILLEISKDIDDPRLISILYFLGESPKIILSKRNRNFLQILDIYTRGEYELVLSSCQKVLLENSTCFELYEIFVKANQRLNRQVPHIFLENSIAAGILNELGNILQKNSETEQSLMKLHKLFNSIGLTSWAYKLFCFFKHEYSFLNDDENSTLFSFLISGYFNPLLANYLPQKSRILFLEAIEGENITPTTSLVRFMLSEDEFEFKSIDVESFRILHYSIIKKVDAKKFQLALDDINHLEAENNEILKVHYINESLLKLKIHCLLELEDWNNSINLIVSSNIDNPNLFNKILPRSLINYALSPDEITLKGNICLPIFIYQYQNYVVNNDLWIAYDNFLDFHSISFPKQIEEIKENFEPKYLVYFLKNICRQDVYDSSYLFENQDELDNERIEICSILMRIDKINYEEYINEISEISRIQLVRKGIKQIDESKIYVDVKGIKKSTDSDIKESFERSLKLSNLSLENLTLLDDNVDNVIVAFYGKSPDSNRIEIKDSNIHITSYSRFRLFADMFYKIRDKFIASNEFGIDTYLSMRIRHGTLQGEIRSVFEKNNLVTKKDETSDSYKNNEYWLTSIGISDSNHQVLFNNVMAELSTSVDSISNDLKNKKLQIRTEKKASEGFFDYSYSEAELLELFSAKFGAIIDYDEFFSSIIEELWFKTERNLTEIREYISHSVRNEMQAQLKSMPLKLESSLTRFEYQELNRLFRNLTECQTEISQELIKISEWFKRSNSQTINDFKIDLPIETTIRTLKRLFKEYGELQPVIEIDCMIVFDGEFFPHFTYIFQNLLHNILQHSGLTCCELKVKIRVSVVNNELVIFISNNISKDQKLEDLNKIINERMELLRQVKLRDNEKIRSEDGTGYLKVHKTIRTDLLRDNSTITIDNVDDNRIFQTEIKFDVYGLQKILNEAVTN